MSRKTLTIDLSGGLREHLENQANKAGLSIGTFIKQVLKKTTKFKGK